MDSGTRASRADAAMGASRLLAGRYRIGELLGRGGMADVYDGLDERLERPVAVKVLRPDVAAQPDMRRRFEIEARAAAGLSHPNIVAVFDTGEDVDGTPFIVMERLPGTTLADRIAGGAIDSSWLRLVAGDVLGALAVAHESGIVHRDVKPGNILISEDGCAKVADFGIAKAVEEAGSDDTHLDLTASNLLVGTPAYLAPERLDGEPATPRSDLYSLGVVLYEAAAGVKPFRAPTAVGVAHAIHEGTPIPVLQERTDLDPQLASAIDKSMARRPDDRFTDARAMAAAIGVAPAAPVVASVSGEATTLIATGAVADATQVVPVVGAATAPPAVASTTLASAMPVAMASPPLLNRVRDVVQPVWQSRRAWILAAAAVIALFLILVSIAPSDSGSPAKASTTATTTAVTVPPTTAAPTTVTAPAVQVRVGKHRGHDGGGGD